ncbi:putative membrane protein [Metabacillus crassostreae]|uniref:DUF2651 family protein n=1 Tax=Metabacillus crassostreae TaxID=929098 RepID=UPI001957EAA1|nr:putative membrane protein [Metabacillus crassostreae]
MEFLLILIIFPALILLLSIFGYMFTKKSYVTPAIIFVVFSFLMLIFFNETFFIWVIAYTVLSIIMTCIIILFQKLYARKKH